MDRLKSLSFLAVAVIVLVAGYSFVTSFALAQRADMTRALETLNQVQAIAEEKVADSTSRAQIVRKVAVVEGAIKQMGEASETKQSAPDRTNLNLYIKLLFSLLLGGAALYVILSKKYDDDETKKWAFSILSLLAGVWIGTAT